MIGPPKVAAELVLREVGLRAAVGPVVEPVVGVELVVAQELEDAAVELVRAGLDLQVHDAAERAAELGRVGARLQLELVERVDAREDHDGLEPGLVVVDAVEHVVVVARTLAVGRERRRGAPGEAAGAVDVRAGVAAQHAGHRAREAHEVAAVERQRLDLLLDYRRGPGPRTTSGASGVSAWISTISSIPPTSSATSMRTFWSTPTRTLVFDTFLKPVISAVTL